MVYCQGTMIRQQMRFDSLYLLIRHCQLHRVLGFSIFYKPFKDKLNTIPTSFSLSEVKLNKSCDLNVCPISAKV